jgi:putative ABC transport system permease protein
MRTWIARVRSAWRVLRRPDQLDAAMDEEMRFHIDMEAERLVRERRLDPAEARRQACVAFGGVEKYKEAGRDTRWFRWIDPIALDVRLAARMLIKHRGLTVAGGFAMAVAIGLGAVGFEVLSEVLDPALPLKDGERIVALQYATSSPGGPERRVLHDYHALREELTSIEQLSAFRSMHRNLVTGTAPPESVRVAEITASGFAVAATPPHLGRYLVAADEQGAAPPVLVIGYDAWRSGFARDPRVIGRSVTLSGVQHTVVGVMPEGFKFPVDHQYWTPLRANPLAYERLQGPELFLFGRLAPGVSLQQAQAQLTTIGRRTAAAHPGTHEHLRPVLLPYPREHLDLTDPGLVWLLRIAQLLVAALTFVVAVNLGILVYARTVTRLGEIAVRTALGASRRRILTQLFVETLVLAMVAAAAGLVLAGAILERVQAMLPANGAVPFWFDFGLSPATVVYAISLAAFAGVIMGVVPGFKATGRGMHASVRDLNGRTGARLGSVWTTLVVAQVAVAVAVLPAALFFASQFVRMELTGPGFPAHEFMVGTVLHAEHGATARGAANADVERMRSRRLELLTRLQSEPGVVAVTYSSAVPGFASGPGVEFDRGTPVSDTTALQVSTLRVSPDFFTVYGAAMLAGRAFSPGDMGAANSVVVNHTFVQQFLATDSALGVRFRYPGAQSPGSAVQDEWYHIVGVVRDFPRFSPAPGSDGEPTVYHAAAPGDVYPFTLTVRFTGSVPDTFVHRFRQIGVEVDPTLQLRRAMPLSVFYDDVRSIWRQLAWGLGLVTTSVLLLSAAGIYALMSFTVAQRTREIGIRAALGAAPRQLLFSIFGRATRQLALGVLLGSLVSAAVFTVADLGVGRSAALLLTVAGVMLIVGLLSAVGPARRGLQIEASETLKAEA